MKPKILFVKNLSFSLFFFLIFYKIFFFKKIYFLTSSNIFFSPSSISILKTINFIHLSHLDIKSSNLKFLDKTKKNTDKLTRYLIKDNFYRKYIINNIYEYDSQFDELIIALVKNNYKYVYEVTELHSLSKNKFFKKYDKYYLIENNFINKYLFKDLLKKNLLISKLLNLFNFINSLSHIKNILKKIRFRSNKINSSKICKKSNNKFEHEILFFPHKGIYYSNLYLKDQFYDISNNSMFRRENILHCSINEESIDQNTLSYYKKNNINFFDWRITKKLFFLLFVKSFFKNLFLIFNINPRLDFLFIKSIFILQIKLYFFDTILKKFNSLKTVLIGYDFLFPSELNILLNKKHINTFCFSERLHGYFWHPENNIKNNFIYGDFELQLEKRKVTNFKKNFYFYGPPRHHQYFINTKEKNLISQIKKDLNFKTVCLILDWHSPVNLYDSSRSFSNNWRNNSIFYHEIINISKLFPKILFLIKNKDFNLDKIDYFSKILSTINNSSNIIFIKYKSILNNPYYAMNMSNFVVGLPTSLLDESIFLKKPTLIFDQFKLMEHHKIYNDNLLIKNSYDFKKKIDFILKNKKKHMLNQNKVREKMFKNLKIKNNNKYIIKEILNQNKN